MSITYPLTPTCQAPWTPALSSSSLSRLSFLLYRRPRLNTDSIEAVEAFLLSRTLPSSNPRSVTIYIPRWFLGFLGSETGRPVEIQAEIRSRKVLDFSIIWAKILHKRQRDSCSALHGRYCSGCRNALPRSQIAAGGAQTSQVPSRTIDHTCTGKFSFCDFKFVRRLCPHQADFAGRCLTEMYTFNSKSGPKNMG